jgi:hypothetical protein
MTVLLKAMLEIMETGSLASWMDINQAKIEAIEVKADTNLSEMRGKMRAGQELLKEEMLAHHERMMARMDSQLEKMEAYLEKAEVMEEIIYVGA